MVRIALLDDYQDVALKYADWSVLPSDTKIQVFRDHLFDEDAIVERLKDFEIIMSMRERTPFPRSLLERLPNLKLLTTTAMLNRAIDVESGMELGITVCGTGSVPSPTVDLTWGLILALLRYIPQEDRAIRDGKWQTSMGIGLQDKTLGVVGLGNLGSKVAVVGKAFGMNVNAWSQNLTSERTSQFGVTLVTKDELFSQSDIVTVHMVLSDRSRGLVGASDIAKMKPTSYLINTSRGPIVDEKALVEALEKGAIAGAGLDVFDQEPLPPDHPLRHLENVVVTPHIGYVTTETYEVFFRDTVENIQAFLEGNPIRVITTSR